MKSQSQDEEAISWALYMIAESLAYSKTTPVREWVTVLQPPQVDLAQARFWGMRVISAGNSKIEKWKPPSGLALACLGIDWTRFRGFTSS